MCVREKQKKIISQLRRDIFHLEGFRPESEGKSLRLGLGVLEDAFPYGVFPTAALHEFLCEQDEDAAACSGFLSILLGLLMQNQKPCIWISSFPMVFPPALKIFGIRPDRIIFVRLHRDRDILWAMEEALKCNGLAAVVAELRELSFSQSRRLQLAVEHSRVTGFVLRRDVKKINTTACVARWRISPQPSLLEDGLPGVGFPQWQVDLLKVKNGQPDSWNMAWTPEGFVFDRQKKTGEFPWKNRESIQTGS
ncbi:ImuA family protein [Pelobium manganitolerans]|uniref:ImuA family protein n=1 Tax=Pelobium manganitolerans TaxID=1842495 RepID=UPI003FA3D8E1